MDFDFSYFNGFIANSNSYYAHLPKETECSRRPELLSEHSALVYAYAKEIISKQSLGGIIENLIESSIPAGLDVRKINPLISDLFYKSIAYHDLGKVNKKFQIARMKNRADVLSVSHGFDSQHSIIGVYLYLADFFSTLLKTELTEAEQVFLSNVSLYLSYSIYKHHAPCLNESQNNTVWDNEDLFVLKSYLSLFKIDLNDEQIGLFHNCFLKNANFNFFFERYNSDVIKKKNTFPLFALCKLNYSLLTASDYLATAHYMNGWTEMYSDYGLIDDALRQKIISNIERNKTYNKAVYKTIAKDDIPNADQLREPSNNNLNELRKGIAIEVIQNIRKNTNKNLFYLEAPTGSGKTNASMLALAELLRADRQHEINKVFYVFPFTTLITQTYKSLSETFGLNVDEIAEIHSKASFHTGNYEDDYLNYLDNLFVNYPISLLSHIRFFDVLKTNGKETNYLLHRMANSIVIIDEIQSYSPKTWDKVIYFINNYAHFFNMKFIIMSATLPKIGEILDDKGLAGDFVYLVKDKSKYFQNPNFCKRVNIDYSLLECPCATKEDKCDYLSRLKECLFEKSEEFAAQNELHPQSVHTIIEFIFKKTASEFYSIVKEDNDFFDEVFLLSGTILEPRRKEIIDKLKSSALRSKKVLLITTQVVEAGVDIDMDLGFKDKSIIDSEEQLAGRINRNVNKPRCTLYLFNCDTEKTLYGKDDRYRFAREMDFEDYKSILDSKDFDRLYKMIIDKTINNNKSSLIENIHDLEGYVATLNYAEVDKQLKLIKSLNDSVFVPIDIPIQYLKNDIPILDEFEIHHGEYVSGTDVWDAYANVIFNRETDFVETKIKIKKLQSLMSAFSFSIFKGGNDYDVLKTYGEEKLGYIYLNSYVDVYSFENGVIAENLKDSNFI
ncbi:MAG: CRISPR-associated helicase Cas3' [Paludibacteraceae bacterium]